jgi:hypothetical protein
VPLAGSETVSVAVFPGAIAAVVLLAMRNVRAIVARFTILKTTLPAFTVRGAIFTAVVVIITRTVAERARARADVGSAFAHPTLTAQTSTMSLAVRTNCDASVCNRGCRTDGAQTDFA